MAIECSLYENIRRSAASRLSLRLGLDSAWGCGGSNCQPLVTRSLLSIRRPELLQATRMGNTRSVAPSYFHMSNRCSYKCRCKSASASHLRAALQPEWAAGKLEAYLSCATALLRPATAAGIPSSISLLRFCSILQRCVMVAIENDFTHAG